MNRRGFFKACLAAAAAMVLPAAKAAGVSSVLLPLGIGGAEWRELDERIFLLARRRLVQLNDMAVLRRWDPAGVTGWGSP